ncbi:MAG TPA: DUF6328 family protein [Actinomycetota bacterium]
MSGGPERDAETEKERLSRKLGELLEELRVALPGVQVLFAFLLTLPFTNRFSGISDLSRDVYFGSFLAAALASVFLIAPSAYHRMRWRFTDREELEDKRKMLITSSRMATTGIVLLGAAIAGVTFVIANVLFNVPVALTVSAAITGVAVVLWFALPLTRRARARQGRGPGLSAGS